MAIAGLNHFELGDRTLTVSRADVSRSSSSVAGMGMVAQSILAQTSSTSRAPPPASRVMLLLNMLKYLVAARGRPVTADELRDDEEYAEILEDIKEEAGKYGPLDDGPMGGVRIPRPQKKDKKWNANITGAAIEARNRMLDEQNGVGRVYVKYKDARSTQKGMEALGGRQFGGRTILVASVPEVSAAYHSSGFARWRPRRRFAGVPLPLFSLCRIHLIRQRVYIFFERAALLHPGNRPDSSAPISPYLPRILTCVPSAPPYARSALPHQVHPRGVLRL